MNVLVRTWNELDCKVDFLLNLLENINKADELVRLFFAMFAESLASKLRPHALIERWTRFYT